MWRVIPVVLSLLLLGAHFLRAGADVPLVACGALIALLAVPRGWAARIVQAALLLGTLEWIRTAAMIAGMRAAAGEPTTRLWVILGSVALVTLASALVFRHRRVARFYRLESTD
jgi:hypothetical protein